MKKALIIITTLIIIIASILIYSRFIATSGLITNEILIKIDNLSNSYDGLKILHFTDLHYGRTVKEKELKKLVKEINNNKPDIVVFTGDLFDKDYKTTLDERTILINNLKNIEAPLGKYIISGEHDSNEEWDNITKEINFTNINDNYKLIFKENENPLIISGISSNLEDKTNIKDKLKIYNDFINDTKEKIVYSILLIHEPDYIDEINVDNYNLILAGHSHGGQIKLPFIGPIIFRDGYKKYYDSYYKINNTDLYISNGLGTSNNNFRLFNKPSINLYRLIKK